MSRHVFTAQETLEGVRASVLSRRDQARLIKKLAKMDFDKTTLEKAIEFFKVIVSSPPGLFLTGSLMIDGLEALGYFGATTSTDTAMSPTKSNASTANVFLSTFEQVFSAFPGGAQILQLVTGSSYGAAVTGQIGTQGSGPSIPQGRVTAGYLQAGLFAICTIQALGGAQGLSTLATAAISALK